MRPADRLAAMIAQSGPIGVDRYMAEANAHYYATRNPIGLAGDFVTAPEISQMFGELIGAWLADLWIRAGSPGSAHYVELGPGRGTLAADALRAMRPAGLEPRVALVETSPALRAVQRERLSEATWHDDMVSLPADGPLLVVANEFFDALPVRQLIASPDGWRELQVAEAEGLFERIAGPLRPGIEEKAPPGTILETSPASLEIIEALAHRISMQGGAAIIFDYGHALGSFGDSFQAVAKHRYADPWREPGERDLTAHVDFPALARAARAQGAKVHGPRQQGEWLKAMGLDARTQALVSASPHRAEEIRAGRDRLAEPDQMGTLFKVIAMVAPNWPLPAGFE